MGQKHGLISKGGLFLTGVTLVLTAALGQAQSLVRPIPGADLSAPGGGLRALPISTYGELSSLEQAQAPEYTTQAQLFVEGRSAGSLENLDSSVNTQRMGWGASVTRRIDEHDYVSIEGELESSFYGWTGSAPLLPGRTDPFNDVYRARLAVGHHHALTERLSLLSGFEVSINGEDEARLTSGLVVGGSGALGFRASDELELTAGLLVSSRLEDDPLAIPYLGIDWQPNERLHLKAQGPRVRLDLALDERWSLGFEALYAQRQYRLNEDASGNAPVFRDETIDLKGELAYAFSDSARLTLSGGISTWREFTFISDDGQQLLEAEQSRQPFVGLGLQLAF